MNPADLPIGDAGQKLRDGSLSAVALAGAFLERIERLDGTVHAFVSVFAGEALAQAEAADRELAGGIDRGPLHGIPVALKDLIDVAGQATACGSRLMAGNMASADAPVVSRLREKGAVLLGKLATYEFALVGPSFDGERPPAANPWNPAHITGGSSSGCAASVGAGLVRTSLGTDTGGSVRSPAGYCGVVGLKPTFGRVSTEGVFPLSPSLDHVGPVSATVAEAALTLDAIADASPHAPAASLLGAGVEGLRLAYPRGWFARDPDAMPEIVAAADDAASRLSLLGARIEEVELPDYALFEAAGAVILHAEALAVHRQRLCERPEGFGHLAFQTLASGLCLSPGEVADARRVAGFLRGVLDEKIFGRFDALLCVNTLSTALPFSAFDGKTAVWTPMRTIPFNVTGHPALALPAGFADGLPISMQIAGKHGDEAGICRIGDAFERATDFSAQRPERLRADFGFVSER